LLDKSSGLIRQRSLGATKETSHSLALSGGERGGEEIALRSPSQAELILARRPTGRIDPDWASRIPSDPHLTAANRVRTPTTTMRETLEISVAHFEF